MVMIDAIVVILHIPIFESSCTFGNLPYAKFCISVFICVCVDWFWIMFGLDNVTEIASKMN